MRVYRLNLDWTQVQSIATARDVAPADVVNEAARLGLQNLTNCPTADIPPRDPAGDFGRWLSDERGWKERSANTVAAEVRKAFASGRPHRRHKLWAAYMQTREPEEV
jgi:hypothetical protein